MIPKLPLVVVLCGFLSVTARADLFVSPAGNDQHDGRSAHSAFATIAHARDEVRRLRTARSLPPGPITVHLLAGDYFLTESIEFTTEDSGTKEQPVIYRGEDQQPVRLIGGRNLKLSEFHPVTDPALAERLDPASRSKIVALSLSALGLKHGGPFPEVFSDNGGVLELFCDGQRLPLSRWPKTGWTTMKAVIANGDAKTPGSFEYREDRPARWLHNPNVWLKGQWRVQWEDPAIHVAQINAESHTIAFNKGIPLGIGNKYNRPAGNGKEPWCAINLPEEIDTPGEWAIDFASQTLLLYPPAGAAEIMVSQLDKPLIQGTGVSNLQLIDLNFEYSLGDGIVMSRADSVLIAGCKFKNLARNGAVLDGSHIGVQSCDMDALGAGCVMITGGNKQTLTPSGNYVINNHLHDYGVLKAMYSAAIDLGFGDENATSRRDAVGIRVANNLIHDAPRDAVLVSGQNNLFELNDIYHCGFGSGDVGAFYSWMDWTIRGVVIKNNYVHDTVGGVNPDDGASGNTVIGNIFAGPRVGIWIASGPDHIARGNIFVKDQGPVFGVDERGISRGYATNKRLLEGVRAIHPTDPPWATQFPEMTSLLETHPELPVRNDFSGNVIVIQSGDPSVLKLKKGDKNIVSIKDNFITNTDPGFVDVEHGNLALKPGSAVFKNLPGFEPIPFDKIGLYVDEHRRSLPSASQTKPPSGNPMTEHQEEKNFGT